MISSDRVQNWSKTVFWFAYGRRLLDSIITVQGDFTVTIVANPRGHQEVLHTESFCWNELSDLQTADDLFDGLESGGGYAFSLVVPSTELVSEDEEDEEDEEDDDEDDDDDDEDEDEDDADDEEEEDEEEEDEEWEEVEDEDEEEEEEEDEEEEDEDDEDDDDWEDDDEEEDEDED